MYEQKLNFAIKAHWKQCSPVALKIPVNADVFLSMLIILASKFHTMIKSQTTETSVQHPIHRWGLLMLVGSLLYTNRCLSVAVSSWCLFARRHPVWKCVSKYLTQKVEPKSVNWWTSAFPARLRQQAGMRYLPMLELFFWWMCDPYRFLLFHCLRVIRRLILLYPSAGV